VDLRELRVDVTAKRYRRRRRDGVEIEESWSPKSHAERTVFITADVADEPAAAAAHPVEEIGECA
jgi:hypothetical protein